MPPISPIHLRSARIQAIGVPAFGSAECAHDGRVYMRGCARLHRRTVLRKFTVTRCGLRGIRSRNVLLRALRVCWWRSVARNASRWDSHSRSERLTSLSLCVRIRVYVYVFGRRNFRRWQKQQITIKDDKTKHNRTEMVCGMQCDGNRGKTVRDKANAKRKRANGPCERDNIKDQRRLVM